MTGIAAVLEPEKASATSRIATLLGAMQSRGSVTRSEMVEAKTEVLGIGSCSHLHEISPGFDPSRTSLAVDGSLADSLALDSIGGEVGLEALSRSFEAAGPFSFVAISTGRVLAGRDLLGQKPLYFGTDREGRTVFASLKAALWKVGIVGPKPVPPGQIMAAAQNQVSVLVDKSLSRPSEADIPEREAVAKLGELLIESLSETIPEESAIAFSGGLDSTLVAQAAEKNDLRPELITVGLKGQAELDHSRKVAKMLRSDITVRELSRTEVLESLPEVVKTIESTEPVLVGVSVPLYFVCQIAKEMGIATLLAGQLSDELFGGYGRFEELAAKDRFDEARAELWKSLLAASTNDFEPGDKLAVSLGLELRCPFAYLPLVRYAMRLPIALKLRVSGRSVVRKYILRRLAADWKLPDSIVNRAKKAVQYSSGVQKILLREAKRRRLSLSRFLESVRTD